MANLPEDAGFIAGITQLETTDPVLGGPGGKANEAPAQLASRTRWLHSLAAALRVRHVANEAAIELDGTDGWEQLLTLNIPSTTLAARLLMIDAIVTVELQDYSGWDEVNNEFALEIRSGATVLASRIERMVSPLLSSKPYFRVGCVLEVPTGVSPTLSLYSLISTELGASAHLASAGAARLIAMPALNQDLD